MMWHLRIALSRTFVQPIPDVGAFACIDGGPPDLLAWLESQLGLHFSTNSCSRVAALVAAMERALATASPRPSVATSFERHPFAVAARLLQYRDSFLIEVPLTPSGETPTDLDVDLSGPKALSPHIPPPLSAFALAAAVATPDERATIMTGEADRVAAVLQAILAGQRLPKYSLILEDEPDAWPARWKGLLEAIDRHHPSYTLEWKPPPLVPQATAGSALLAVQSALLPENKPPAVPPAAADASLRAVRSTSAAVAAHAVACVMKELTPEELAETIVVCADDHTAAMIDGLLHAFDRPTMGVSVASHTSDILAILPLAIAAVGIPSDPERVKEFLALSASPFPQRLRQLLHKAIDDTPAVGSPPWNSVLRTVAAKWKNGAKWAALVNAWIPPPTRWKQTRQVFDGGAMTAAIARVAKWANRRRRSVEKMLRTGAAGAHLSPAEQAHRTLLECRKAHYRCLSSRCKSLLVLLQSRGPVADYDHVDIMQLLDSTMASPTPQALHPETVGAPRRVRSLADIGEAFRGVQRVLWVGPARRPMAQPVWAHRDVAAMKTSCDVSLDTERTSLNALTRAEYAGLCRVAGSVLVVCHPSLDSFSRPHPLWALITEMLRVGGPKPHPHLYEPPLLDPSCATPDLAPWCVTRSSVTIERSPVGIHKITLPAHVQLRQRKTVSHSDVERRLSCPVAWAIHYGGSISRPMDATLPSPWIRRGIVGERVLREIFSPTPPPSLADAESKLGRIWKRRLPRLDGQLSLPESKADRDSYFETLRRALPVLQTLIDAKVAISFGKRIDQFITKTGLPVSWQSKKPTGAVDVIGIVGAAGVPIVIDMKYGSLKKHAASLKEARCSQLILYSLFVGNRKPGTAVDAIGYFILSEGTLLVPTWADGVLAASTYDLIRQSVDTPLTITLPHAITDLDKRVAASTALMHAPGATLEAHPRLAVSGGTLHSDLASVHGTDAAKAEKEACQYCQYGLLCGRDGVV